MVLLVGCGVFGDKDNSDPPAPLVELENTLAIKTRWDADLDADKKRAYPKLAPLVFKDTVYLASNEGEVAAFDAASGKQRWEVDLDIPLSAGPGLGETRILLGTPEGVVIALDMSTGKEQWRYTASSEILAAPQGNSGVVVVRSLDGQVVGLKAISGEKLWALQHPVPSLSLRGNSTPILLNDAAIIGFDDGELVAIDLQAGKDLWKFEVAAARGRSELERMVDIDADMVLLENTLYAVSFQGRLVAVDIFSGTLIWKQDVSAHAGIGVDATTLYLSDENSHVWAFDRYSGNALWKQEKLQARQLTAPVAVGDYVVVGDLEGYLHWLRREDGQFVARNRPDGDRILAPLQVQDNTVFAYYVNGQMFALQAK